MKTALILSAGAGTRMMPLTATRPKPLLPVAGRPMIEWSIQALESAGIEKIFVLIRKGDDKIRDALGDRVSYLVQEEPLGTANAIGCAEGHINEPFICMNGDLVFEESLLPELIKSYKKKRCNTITVTQSSQPENFGVVELDAEKNVISIEEKPETPKGNYINAGVYAFGADIFEDIKSTKKSGRGEYEITDTLRMSSASGHVYDGFWLDVGKPWDLLDANEFHLKRMKKDIRGDVHPNAVLEGEVSIGEGSAITAGAYVKGPVTIGKNCRIGPNCYIRPYTALGDDVHIGNAVEIKNCIIMSTWATR